jgi:hypothetical protein
MSKAPAWRTSRRTLVRSEIRAKAAASDLASTASGPATRGQEQLAKYLHATLMEYFKIRSGPSGYQQFIDAAMKPPPQRESVDETMKRLTGEKSEMSQMRGSPPSRP